MSVIPNANLTQGITDAVLRLAVQATAPTELPFTGLNGPSGVALDSAGDAYVADTLNNRVLKLPRQ